MSDRNENGMTLVTAYRYGMGAEILKRMEENDDLPLPNIHRVAKVMQEVFINEGMVDRLNEEGYKWRPNADYWRMRMSDIAEYMRKIDNLFFMFVRDQGKLKGQWRFVGKAEFEEVMGRDIVDIETRGKSYNNKATDGIKTFNSDSVDGLHVFRKLLTD